MTTTKKSLLGAALVLVLLVGYQAAFRWPAAKQAQAKQEKWIAAIEGRNWGRAQRLTSELYSDSLGLDRDRLFESLRDVGFVTGSDFQLNWEMIDLRRDGDAIVITGNLRLSGGLGPAASQVESYARRYANKPFTFRWRKTGLMPWSWQLESAAHPDASLPDGYTPGDVRRLSSLGGF